MEYLNLATIIIRLTFAFLAGLVVGLERQIRMKPLGFGTFTLVSSGACAFMLVTESLTISGQSLPIAAGVVTGIGFLGAGTLIKEGPSVMGFTTNRVGDMAYRSNRGGFWCWLLCGGCANDGSVSSRVFR